MNDVEKIFGATLVGVMINIWSFGLICLLIYNYYTNFPTDGRGNKLMVAWMGLLQLLTVVFLSKLVYYYLVKSFGMMENLAFITWEWPLCLGLQALSAFSVQAYYARRIHLLIKSNLLFGIILGLALSSLGFGLAFMSEVYIRAGISQYSRILWISISYFLVGTMCDVVIAVVQVAYLHMHQPDSDNPGMRTGRIIKILMLYIISTGFLTSIVAIIQVITLGILHLNYAQLVFSNTIGALYAISLLANLDSRRILREVDTETEGLDGLRTSRIRLGLRNISFRKASTTNLSNAMESLSGATMDVSALRSTTEDREATVSGKGNIESVV